MTKESFLKGAAILGIAGIFVKVLGVFYRIPITNIIGDEGLGYFQTANPLYVLLLTISTSGFPIAVAKLVSEKRALGDYRGAHRIFKISFLGFLIAGTITSLFVFFGAETIASLLGNRNAYYSLMALGPALFFVPIMSAFRGYFQGRQTMAPTAISQVVEQFARVIVGVGGTYYLYNLGKGIEVAAGGASFGGSAGAILGTIVVIGLYVVRRKSIKAEIRSSGDFGEERANDIIRRILTIAIPITIGASIVPVMDTIDAAIVMRRLQAIGYSVKETTGLYGQLKGIAQNFINLPQVLSVALGISLIPAISDAFARKNYDGIRKITRSGVRITLFIGFPAALGLYILANPILDLFYSDAETVRSASVLLQISAFSVIFLTLVQSLTAILQGLGKQIIPVRNLAIGALVKVILTYVLTGIKGIGIMGAAFSTVVAFFIAAVLNFVAVKKHTLPCSHASFAIVLLLIILEFFKNLSILMSLSPM